MDKIMEFMPFMLEGTVVTIEIFFLTLIISLPLGLPVALGSNSGLSRCRLSARFMCGYSEELPCCCRSSSSIFSFRWCSM